MLGVIANTVLLTEGCDNKVESRRRSSVMTICAMTLVAMVVASRSTLRHMCNILLQSLHAQGRLARKSVSDIEAVRNEYFHKTGRALVSESHILERHREPALVPRQ